ncbi:hypothetical protein [Dongia sp.]|uniref:hypothetical protein n=1 Tax=Dongia sp. TaxID=1977262 RepID=UPI0035ADB2B1
MTRYTRTHETQSDYLTRAHKLLERYRAANDLDISKSDIDVVAFTSWLISIKPTYKVSSWRTMRQSVRTLLEAWPIDGADNAIAMLDADIAECIANPREPDDDSDDRTSALKEKKMPHGDLTKLLVYLTHFSRSSWSQTAVHWLNAGLSTGLRPSEWKTAKMVKSGDQVLLIVKNGKNTNGRANGPFRTLDISDFTPEGLKSVEYMAAHGALWNVEGRYAGVQSSVSQLIYHVCERIFDGRIYCLYSLRHQFVANMKSLKELKEIAALLGHCVTATSTQHYGKRRDAWAEEHIVDIPDARESETETVRENAKYFERILDEAINENRRAEEPENMAEYLAALF